MEEDPSLLVYVPWCSCSWAVTCEVQASNAFPSTGHFSSLTVAERDLNQAIGFVVDELQFSAGLFFLTYQLETWMQVGFDFGEKNWVIWGYRNIITCFEKAGISPAMQNMELSVLTLLQTG